MKRILLVALMTLTGLGVLALRSHGEPPNKVSAFMKAKLTHSKNVLAGLATEDYKQIASNAQDLALLSQAATWKVLQTEEYLRHSNEFRRSADALKKAADDENLDGATLAYVQMTMNCVKCHKYVRETAK
jgi:cytochrome c556